MGLFDAHDKFRDSLPGAEPTAKVYDIDAIIRDAEERQALIESIPNPRERAAIALEYVAKISPAVGAFTGPQGAAIGAAVGTLALVGSKMIRTNSEPSPEDTAALIGGIGDIVALFRHAKDPAADGTEATPAPVLDAVEGVASAVAKHLPAGHHDTSGGGSHHTLPHGHHDTSGN